MVIRVHPQCLFNYVIKILYRYRNKEGISVPGMDSYGMAGKMGFEITFPDFAEGINLVDTGLIRQAKSYVTICVAFSMPTQKPMTD